MNSTDKEELKRRINERIDKDDSFSEQAEKAIKAGAFEALLELIARVLGFVIRRGTQIWDWLQRLF